MSTCKVSACIPIQGLQRSLLKSLNFFFNSSTRTANTVEMYWLDDSRMVLVHVTAIQVFPGPVKASLDLVSN